MKRRPRLSIVLVVGTAAVLAAGAWAAWSRLAPREVRRESGQKLIPECDALRYA